MNKITLAIVFIATSFSYSTMTMAEMEKIERNQCPIPGEVISRQFLQEEYPSESDSFSYTAQSALETNYALNVSVKRNRVGVWNTLICKQIAIDSTERTCDRQSHREERGKLEMLFNPLYDQGQRAMILKQYLVGLNDHMPVRLANFLLSSAAGGRTPNTWKDFYHLLEDAKNSQIISGRELGEIGNNAAINQKNFGLASVECSDTPVVIYKNVIDAQIEKAVIGVVNRNFVIQVKNSPILFSEKAVFEITANAFDTPVLVERSNLNRSEISFYGQMFEVNGLGRNRVNPPINLAAQLIKHDNFYNVSLRNLAYTPKLDGKLVVNVKIYQKRFILSDVLIGNNTLTPVGGESAEYNTHAKILNEDKDHYMKISLHYEGSTFYNSNESSEITLP